MIRDCTEAEGPGKRLCIWLQGCNLGCKNCINDQMLEFKAKNIISIKSLQKHILESKEKYDLEGVTFLGGEPFLQANGLKYIAKLCQEIDLSVMCFSGFKYEQLRQNIIDGSNELLSYVDVLIDDIYIESLKDNSRNWVGSTNQSFYYFSDRYNSSIETDEKYNNKVEINIVDNKILVNGEAEIVKEFINEY
jgi:anaerobic ribonucleoside-triphosphate reductase activating protein